MWGFTFVELLIAATMMSVLFVGLATHLRGGITVWRRATGTGESLQRQRVALNRLERDLANAIVYDVQEDAALPSQFGSTELQWLTVRPSTPARFGKVEVVTYRCAQVDGVRGFWRTSQSVGAALTGGEVTPELLVPSCEWLSFQYAYLPAEEEEPIEWHDSWDDPEELPRLIAASVRFEAGRESRRVAWIPSGALKAWTSE